MSLGKKVKETVKFALEQTIKSQSGSTDIALLLLTSVIDGVRGLRHAPAALPPEKRPGKHCTEGWICPRAGVDVCGKSRPNRNSIHEPSSP
jgi:hypothetical protein